MTLYASRYGESRLAHQNAHGVWWCPFCDRSHAPGIRVCDGCHVMLEEGPSFATATPMDPYDLPSTAAPAPIARLHPDLRADVGTVTEDEPTVPVAHKQRPQDRPRRKPGAPGRTPKGGRR